MAEQAPQPGGFDPVRRRLLKLGAAVALAAGSPAAARILLARDAEPVPAGAPTTTDPLPPTTASSSRLAPTPTTGPVAATTTTTVVEPLVVDVIPREAWGAGPAGAFQPHTPVRLTVHHTAGAGIDAEGAPARMRGYQAFHQQQGWPDIAYHFVIDQAGGVYQGRPPDARGDTFTEYDPTGHLLVCLDGDFDEHHPSVASIASLVDVLAWAAQAYSIASSTLAGHRDYASTSCPGENLYSLRDPLEARLTTILSSGRGVALSPTPGDERSFDIVPHASGRTRPGGESAR